MRVIHTFAGVYLRIPAHTWIAGRVEEKGGGGGQQRAGPNVNESDRAPWSRLCRAAASQYRVSSEVKLVSDLCQSRATIRVRLTLFLSFFLSFSLLLFYAAYASFCALFTSLPVPAISFVVSIPFARIAPSEINVSRSPGLSPGARETHIHGNTQCHSVELLPVGKEQKLVYKADAYHVQRPSSTTVNSHRSSGSLVLSKLRKFGTGLGKRVATLSRGKLPSQPVPKVNKWSIEVRRTGSRSSSSVQLSSGA
ncbi:uncharacterized protein LOC118647736 [Monomorium pharaonis]|uniref:uncharacterized protein LOC118647736 n=1 Tax=Monomorium pharaonis TaxID=307658 RepID=UPI001747B331|nr:uncharacterized protein LOC118647736 [Monomorium pharaonis]